MAIEGAVVALLELYRSGLGFGAGGGGAGARGGGASRPGRPARARRRQRDERARRALPRPARAARRGAGGRDGRGGGRAADRAARRRGRRRGGRNALAPRPGRDAVAPRLARLRRCCARPRRGGRERTARARRRRPGCDALGLLASLHACRWASLPPPRSGSPSTPRELPSPAWSACRPSARERRSRCAAAVTPPRSRRRSGARRRSSRSSARRSPSSRWRTPSRSRSSASPSWPRAGRSPCTCARRAASSPRRPGSSKARTPRWPTGSWSWRSAPSAAAASSSSRTCGPTRASRGSSSAVEESGVRRALFIPLLVRDEAIGALAVYRRRPRPYREGEESLLLALSGQLAVAVQNARLHERAKELSAILERTLESERLAARQLRGLYAVSQSFAESLSLEATLDGVARAMVELLDADAAVIRMPDERNEVLTARAVHVGERADEEVVARLVARPQPLSAPLARRLLRSKQAVLLRPGHGRAGGRPPASSSPSSGRAPPPPSSRWRPRARCSGR